MPALPRLLILSLMTATLGFAAADSAAADDPLLFISNFAPAENGKGAKGAIQSATLDLASGALRLGPRTEGVENPFFLALSPSRRFLYSIHARQFGSPEPEQVAAYEVVGQGGELKLLNRRSTHGSASCHLQVDATGRTLLVANYTTGDIAALPVNNDGSLEEAATFIRHSGSSVDPVRQKAPFAHSLITSPDNRFAMAADLGLDKILIYQLDGASARLTPHLQPFARTPPGAGPRHLAFHPNGRHLYVINELKNSVTMFLYRPAEGLLLEQQTIATLPADFEGVSHCADLKITPDGRFLYGTNRGHDSIAGYRIADDGRLSLIEIVPSLGKGPQNLALAPGGSLLLCANMPGNNVAVFRIDPQTGALKSVGEPTPQTSPSCIMIVDRK